MKYAIGADIGGTAVKLGLFDETGKLIDKWEIETDKSDNGKNVLPDVAASINEKLNKLNVDKSLVAGVGFGVPGPVIDDGIVNKCINIGWGVVNVKKSFLELSGMQSLVANDANVAALGEVWKGGGRGKKNVVMVTLGTGVGGGVVVNGNIIAGANGAGGEIGHIPVSDDEEAFCNCGKRGCLEQYSSASGLVKVAKKILSQKNDESKLREIKDMSAKDICDCARKNDLIAIEAINYSMKILGKFLAAISCVVDPELFVIGGGLSKSGDLLLEPLKKSYRENAYYASVDTEFSLAELGNDAGIYGGAKLVLINTDK